MSVAFIKVFDEALGIDILRLDSNAKCMQKTSNLMKRFSRLHMSIDNILMIAASKRAFYLSIFHE